MHCPLHHLLLWVIQFFYLFNNTVMKRKNKTMKKITNYILYCSLNASFTLEATVIFPIILSIIIYIFLLVISLHDTMAAKAISYRYLISYSMKIQDSYCHHNKTADNINSEIQNVSIINNTSHFFLKPEKNNLKVISSDYNTPVTFSNYNNTKILWAYKAGKTFFIKTDTNKTTLP